MTYLGFHLVFILPPLLWLAWLYGRGKGKPHPRAGTFLLGMAAIALLYTTPWDNYLVWRGVWGYGEDRVLGTLGYVPFEEYLFFLLQPLLTGLWLYRLLPPAATAGGVTRGGRSRRPPAAPAHRASPAASAVAAPPAARTLVPRHAWSRLVGAGAYVAMALLGALLLRSDSGTYLGLILAWAAPVLAAQWAFAGPAILARRGLFLRAVAVPTLYLWVADATAIHMGIWEIADRFTLGPALGPLPLEEAVFFLVTNLLVVQGLLLFLYPPSWRDDAEEARAPVAASLG